MLENIDCIRTVIEVKDMKKHYLKLNKRYETAKLEGKKPFEIRKADRNFKVGDTVEYQVVNDKGEFLDSALKYKEFEITFITDFMQIAGYIVFGEKEIK